MPRPNSQHLLVFQWRNSEYNNILIFEDTYVFCSKDKQIEKKQSKNIWYIKYIKTESQKKQ